MTRFFLAQVSNPTENSTASGVKRRRLSDLYGDASDTVGGDVATLDDLTDAGEETTAKKPRPVLRPCNSQLEGKPPICNEKRRPY